MRPERVKLRVNATFAYERTAQNSHIWIISYQTAPIQDPRNKAARRAFSSRLPIVQCEAACPVA
jgi:hypothetical protein